MRGFFTLNKPNNCWKKCRPKNNAQISNVFLKFSNIGVQVKTEKTIPCDSAFVPISAQRSKDIDIYSLFNNIYIVLC